MLQIFPFIYIIYLYLSNSDLQLTVCELLLEPRLKGGDVKVTGIGWSVRGQPRGPEFGLINK
jgi:hypothetical protein